MPEPSATPAGASAPPLSPDDPAIAGALWRGLVEQIPAVTYVADFDAPATLRYISPQVQELLGRPAEGFLSDPELWHRCVHPADLDRVVAEELRTFSEEVTFDCEYRMLHADGHAVSVWERDTIIRDGAGTPTHTQGVVIDVSPLRVLRGERDAERARAARYLDVAGTAILALDPDGRVQLLNRAGYELIGLPEGSLTGRHWLQVTTLPGEDTGVPEVFARAMATGIVPERTERELTRPDGSKRLVAWSHRILRDEDGTITGLVSSGTDVTERRAAAEQITHLANHDAVTGLPNRRLFSEHLDLALARAHREDRAVALLYLDLDDFKLVNDSLGHSAGDRLLVKVARRLRTRTRSADLLARHGGDEFLVLLADLDHADAVQTAEHVAHELLAALATPFVVSGAEFHVGASVGISLLPADALDAETLLRHADAAMYQAKGQGHGEVRRFDPDRGEPLARLSMTTRLRHAITDEQLGVHWQPIVDPVSGRLAALEALVRWHDPIRGLVMPAEFVAFAEETGIIDALGELVLELVLRQRVQWRRTRGIEPTVHVNLSPHELRDPAFAGRVAGRMHAHDVDPGTVVLEITESAAMQDPARIGPVLDALSASGLRIAIDDFGSGHSSLARLAALPVHLLKVDRSFLAKAPTDPASAAVLEAIVNLAQSLGMACVAEGVETEEQRRHVADLGCPLAQGYLLGRPVAAHELPAALLAPPG